MTCMFVLELLLAVKLRVARRAMLRDVVMMLSRTPHYLSYWRLARREKREDSLREKKEKRRDKQAETLTGSAPPSEA